MGKDRVSPVSAASRPSVGRIHPVDVPSRRSEFERDRDRVSHAPAFRRLAHKTQVFIDPQGDHVRTRLTHTIEVSQIARSLARRLRLDEDLAETVALAHDLGHPPFGHVGEGALDRALRDHGGFDHNAQAVRIVEWVDRRYAGFPGLNLTHEAVEGIMAHNGPLLDVDGLPFEGRGPLDPVYRAAADAHGIDVTRHASAEAQCAAVADDIAYDCHDIEDGYRSGLLSLEHLAEMPMVGDLMRSCGALDAEWPEQAVHETVRRLMATLVDDVVATAEDRLASLAGPDAVRTMGSAAVGFSVGLARDEGALKADLRRLVYHSDRLAPERARAREAVTELVERFLDDPDLLPCRWLLDLERGRATLAEQVRDYVSGMTDRFATAELERVIRDDAAPRLR